MEIGLLYNLSKKNYFLLREVIHKEVIIETQRDTIDLQKKLLDFLLSEPEEKKEEKKKDEEDDIPRA